MRFFCVCFLWFVFLAGDCLAHEQSREHKVYRVIRVIDGDTIVLDNREHVRLIGIDAPELKENAKFQRDLQNRGLSKSTALAMGKQSYRFLKKLLEGKKVRLEFDVVKYDEYHRILAYVYLLNGQLVNAQIIKDGYAYVSQIKPDIRHAVLFSKLYAEAKQYHRGLWKAPRGHSRRGRDHEKGFQWFSHH